MQQQMTTYAVIIVQDGQEARLTCDTLEEALQVRRSFENYGRCQEIRIEKESE
jgi:hypothetical protein